MTRISGQKGAGNESAKPPRLPSGDVSTKGWLGSILLFIWAASLTCCNRGPGDDPAAGPDKGKLQQLASALDADMEATGRQASALAERVVAAYGNLAETAKSVNSGNYRLEPNGVLYRPDAVKTGVPAVFVSGAVKVDERIINIVKGTESIDSDLKKLVTTSEIIVQCYYNDRNSYNRIYPPFHVLSQYPPGMEIPQYNFYYLADDHHNPGRKSTWIQTPYVDPAGRGWMVSCLAPVYLDDQLEGVCGLDVTVDALVRDMDLEGSNNLYILVSNDGTVVAAGEKMSRILRLPNLKRHRYVDTVRSDTLRTDDYNLKKSSSTSIREMINDLTAKGSSETRLDLDGQKWRVRSASLTRLDWHVLEFATLR